MSERVSFVIATRNRPDTLVWCLRSCLMQEGIDPEILVYDDASRMPVSDFIPPDIASSTKVSRLEKNVGYCALRIRGYQESSNDYIVSLDDDTILFSPDAVKRAIQLLDRCQDIAVVGLRYYERPRADSGEKSSPPTAITQFEDVECGKFTGALVIIRKDAAIKCGLYPEWIYRQGEERFLAIRLLDAGYRIVLHGPPSAIHLYSPIRDTRAMHWYGIRNTLLFDWICVPHPYLLPYLFKDIVKLFFYKISIPRIPTKCGAIAWGLASIVQKWSLRNPVSRATFRKYLRLPRHGPLPLPPDWSPEPLVKMGIINDARELDPYLKS